MDKPLTQRFILIRGREYRVEKNWIGPELFGFILTGKSGAFFSVPIRTPARGMHIQTERKAHPLSGVTFRVMNGVLEVEEPVIPTVHTK